MFEKGKVYEVAKVGSKYDDFQGEYIKTMKNQNGVRFAVFKRGTKTLWIPEMYWKHIKEVKE